jgi:hypothetical protein
MTANRRCSCAGASGPPSGHLQVEEQRRRSGTGAARRELVIRGMLFISQVMVAVLRCPLEHPCDTSTAHALFARGRNGNPLRLENLRHRHAGRHADDLSGAGDPDFERFISALFLRRSAEILEMHAIARPSMGLRGTGNGVDESSRSTNVHLIMFARQNSAMPVESNLSGWLSY